MRRVLSNEWLANLKKNYLTSGFFGTPFLCHQRNGVKEKKYKSKTQEINNIYFGYVLLFLFTFGANKKRKRSTKKKRNQCNQLEFVRILVHKFSGTRPKNLLLKFNNSMSLTSNFVAIMRYMRIQAKGL